jgi:hypothetical protein
MPDLHGCTNDELVSEVEHRLGGNTLGFNGLYSTNQQNYREAWVDVMDWLHDMCNADFDKWNPHRQMMTAALERHGGDNVQNRRQVYAVNTTFHGRSAFEDHAPEQAA